MARSSSHVAKSYRSKVDTWLAALIGFAMIMALVGAIISALEDGPLRVAQAFMILLSVIGLVVWVFVGTNYTLDNTELLVRSGPFRWRIPFGDIRDIDATPSRNPFTRSRSGPALSMDRITILYGAGKSLMISPAEKQTFIRDLESRRSGK